MFERVFGAQRHPRCLVVEIDQLRQQRHQRFAVGRLQRLQDYVKAKLLPYKYPREIRFIGELPKTGTGKIDRQSLLRM